MRSWITTIIVAVVAITAGILSASHIITLGLGALTPDHAWQAYLLPLPIDGALLMASMSLAEAKRQGQKPGGVVWLTLILGVLGSIAANLAAAPPTLTARLLAVSAPIALALSVEILLAMNSIKRNGPVVAPESPSKGLKPLGGSDDTREGISSPYSATAETKSIAPIPVTPDHVQEATPKISRSTKSNGSKLPADTREANRIMAQTYRDQGIMPNRAQVRRDHKVGAPRADQIIRLIRDMTSGQESEAPELVPVGA